MDKERKNIKKDEIHAVIDFIASEVINWLSVCLRIIEKCFFYRKFSFHYLLE